MDRTVIVADYSSSVRRQVAQALEQAGYQVREAADRREALQRAGDCNDSAMIVGDVDMSMLGGIEVLQEVRAKCSAMPMLVLTGESDPSLLDRARASGAGCCLLKPFDAAQLVDIVDTLTGHPAPQPQAAA
jgi:two-component system chemotaxis response regulator CheY